MLSYNYFRFRKTADRHIVILLYGFNFDLIFIIVMLFSSTYQTLSKSNHAQLSYDIISIFKMAATESEI